MIRHRLAPLILLLAILLTGCATSRPAPPVPPPAPVHPVRLPVAPDLAHWLASPATCCPGPGVPAEKVLTDVVALHNQSGGASYSLYFGNLAGQKLYMVSPFPDLTHKVHAQALSGDTLRPFLAARKSLLGDPRCSLGTWYDSDSRDTFLDVSVALVDRAKAVALGKKYNQISIFYLGTMTEIKTGGTGKPLPGWPPPMQRVPPLNMPLPAAPMTQPAPVPAA